MTSKPNGMKAPLHSEFYDNPSLYGLRRSTRAHKSPERFQADEEKPRRSRSSRPTSSDNDFSDEDNDSEDVSISRRKKKRSKAGTKSKIGSKRSNSNDSYDYYAEPYEDTGFNAGTNDDEEDEDGEFFQSQKHEASSRAKKKQRVIKSGSSTPQYTPTRFSSRTSKIVNYNIDQDNDDADLMDSEDEKRAQAAYVQDYIVEDPSGKSIFCFFYINV